MRRLIILLLLLAACGEVAAPVSTTPSDGQGPPSTSAPGDPSTDPADTPQPDALTTTTGQPRQMAPDFTLELGDGGSYTLSEGAKPVYLVFWAEW